MGPVGAVFDSTIIIDHLNGIPAARDAIARWDPAMMSVISWIEVLVGLRDGPAEARGRLILATMSVLPLSDAVAEEAVRMRRQRRLKLPDAIILATARVHGLVLITRNTKDFDANDPSIRTPYTL